MLLLAQHGPLVCFLALAGLLLSSEARAQSDDRAKRAAFAALLTRRSMNERRDQRLETLAADRHDAHLAHLATLHHSTPADGLPPSTPVVPSGNGVRKDTFVESLFNQLLGRDPDRHELLYWTKLLKDGAPPVDVARVLFDSAEHKAYVARGGPNLPFKKAYPTAYHKAHPTWPVPWRP